jgi:hypothetical protein
LPRVWLAVLLCDLRFDFFWFTARLLLWCYFLSFLSFIS